MTKDSVTNGPVRWVYKSDENRFTPSLATWHYTRDGIKTLCGRRLSTYAKKSNIHIEMSTNDDVVECGLCRNAMVFGEDY